MKKLLLWLSVVVSPVAVCVGALLLLWAFVCLLGGPDGKFGDPESFFYAFLFGAVGYTVVWSSWKWFRWSLRGIR